MYQLCRQFNGAELIITRKGCAMFGPSIAPILPQLLPHILTEYLAQFSARLSAHFLQIRIQKWVNNWRQDLAPKGPPTVGANCVANLMAPINNYADRVRHARPKHGPHFTINVAPNIDQQICPIVGSEFPHISCRFAYKKLGQKWAPKGPPAAGANCLANLMAPIS